MKYLKKFEEKASYDNYINSDEAILPNISYVEEDNIVYYNPYDTTIDTTGFANGVYAVTANYKLIDYKTADKSCIGVAFISAKQKVMIAKADATDGTNTQLYWSKNLYKQDVPNLENLADATAAMADYNGKVNTAAIIAGYTELDKDMDSRDICKVLETYNEGGYTDWYIPAAGQLYEFYSNKRAIEAALTAINGTKFNTSDYYWSSSEESADRAWDVAFSFSEVASHDKASYSPVRFVRDLQ